MYLLHTFPVLHFLNLLLVQNRRWAYLPWDVDRRRYPLHPAGKIHLRAPPPGGTRLAVIDPAIRSCFSEHRVVNHFDARSVDMDCTDWGRRSVRVIVELVYLLCELGQ